MLLMHQNKPIAKIKIENNKPINYEEIYYPEELPMGTIGNGKQQEQILLNHWYKSRSIPKTRPNLQKLENHLGINSNEILFKNYGISITDTYWFKSENENILWEDINYHDNGFDPIFAQIYLNSDIQGNNMFSPDFTTDGIMEKFWYISGDKPYLAKIDSLYGNTLSANEIVYYKTAASIGIETTPYMMTNTKTKSYVSTPCFINNSSEDYISTMQLKHSNFSLTGENLINYICTQLGYEKQIKEMITLDVFFHNKDRHEKNMGFKKTPNGNLIWIPAFDNGFSLGADRQYGSHITDKDMKLFNCSRLDILKKYGIPLDLNKTLIESILKETYELYHIDEKRYEIAKDELNTGFELMNNINKNKYILIDYSFQDNNINLVEENEIIYR